MSKTEVSPLVIRTAVIGDTATILRFVRDLGPAAVTVLGNHDLYLLMVAYGAVRNRGKDDTIQPILDAPDREALLGWLRTRPLRSSGRNTLPRSSLISDRSGLAPFMAPCPVK